MSLGLMGKYMLHIFHPPLLRPKNSHGFKVFGNSTPLTLRKKSLAGPITYAVREPPSLSLVPTSVIEHWSLLQALL